MQKLQLYIGTQRLELFKDETVSFTQTLKNVKDISKIFTEFTKTFSVPASKNNNKVFAHYYNFHINSPFVFDARRKVNASLELNDLPFKTGKVKLEGVDLKNNLAHTYRITFFGNTVDLKDILGDNQLSSLTSLNSLNQVYTYDQVKSHLGQSSNNGNILVPLITHTTRMIYNTGLKGNNGVNGNAYYNTNNATRELLNGIDWNEFKYAIRVQAIITAIQTQYSSITFSSDFFNKTYPTNARFTNLFMWLHRKKGGVETFDGDFTYTLLTDLDDIDNVVTGANQIAIVELGGLRIENVEPNTTWTLKLKVLPVQQAITYTIRVTQEANSTTTTLTFNNVTGNQQQSDIDLSEFYNQEGTYTIEIGTSSTVNFNAGSIEFQVDVEEREGSNTITGRTTYSNANAFVTTPDLDFNIIEQIPKMKIIDFLSGIFKMFNLVAYVNDAGVIVVKEVDSYYLSSISNPPINIDKYLDTTKSQVDVALPFSSVNFTYKGLGTILAKQYEQIYNTGWGSTSFSLDSAIYDAPSEAYKVELPFEHMMYERLYNVVDDASTTIQFGYFVDDNQDPYYGEPLLFYPILQNSSTTTINLKNPIVSPVTVEELNTYFIPSNSLSLLPSTSRINIHFNNELNEYTANETGNNQNKFTDTLFEEYYKTYITNIFNVRRRLTKVTAYLPMKIYYNLELNNTIQLGQNNYWINSMTTDLTTGKTNFELLNKLDAEPQPI